MANVKIVEVKIGNQFYDLKYNSNTQKYEGSIVAPNVTSWNANSGHYYPVIITAVDQANNITSVDDKTGGAIGEACKLRVREKTPPTINIIKPSNGARTTIGKPNFEIEILDGSNGSGVDPSRVEIKLDGNRCDYSNSYINNGLKITGTLIGKINGQALSEGSHTLSVTATDNDGNTSSTTCSFTVDTIPPSLNVSSPSNNFITNYSTINISGTTDDSISKPVTITIKVNGKSQGDVTVNPNGTFSQSITITEGENNINIIARDIAGLTSEVERWITLDTKAPTIKSVNITPNPVDCGKTLSISVEIADLEEIEHPIDPPIKPKEE